MSTPPKNESKKGSTAEVVKKGYNKGDALKNTVADLDKENFRNKDVAKWSAIKNNMSGSSRVSAPGLSSLNQKTKLPRYNKK
jgi:hypothetical protein